MIKAVVFDLGKVLLDFDYRIAAHKLAARGKLPAVEIARAMDHSPLLFRYETGLLTSRQFYHEICALSGFAGSFEEFADTFADIFVPMEPMVKLQTELRRSGLPTYIFSNTNEIAVGHIRRAFPFFANFDGYVLSYQHGSMKPDAPLYEVVERCSGCRGPQILYLDDRPENVAAGAARGWNAVLQETPEKTRKLVEGLGLLNGQFQKTKHQTPNTK